MSATPSVEASENPSARWLLGTFALIALLVGVETLVAWRMDVFGILRDTKGRSLITSRRERKAKYLLSQAYVPTNFDALIIGSSISVNWPTANLMGFKFYNESLEGGNATEERTLVDHGLAHGHFKLALMGLYPHITGDHSFRDGLDQANWKEALGSLDALDIQEEILTNRLKHRPALFYPDGSHDLPSASIFKKPEPGDPKLDVSQDPKALGDYRGLVDDLTAHGVRVIYFYYPFSEWNYQYNHEGLVSYVQAVARNMPPEPTIDFNSPQYEFFRNDATNYVVDAIHLSPKGADTLTRLLNRRLQEILQNHSSTVAMTLHRRANSGR
jgi:hypothetical protein